MNTASRMESNGVRNRIQVSEATAEELRAFDKSNWLVPREDKIFAKGKGEMQAYCELVVASATMSFSYEFLTSLFLWPCF